MKTENPIGVHFKRPLSITHSTMVTLEMEREKAILLQCNSNQVSSQLRTTHHLAAPQVLSEESQVQKTTNRHCGWLLPPSLSPTPSSSFWFLSPPQTQQLYSCLRLVHLLSFLCLECFLLRWPRGWLVPPLLSSLYSEVTFVESPLLATLCNI